MSKTSIYKITQISTGKIYIGQTGAMFATRFYGHIKSNNDTKIAKALESSKITDWSWQVIEELGAEADVHERESFWINYYDSVKNGFNQNGSQKKKVSK